MPRSVTTGLLLAPILFAAIPAPRAAAQPPAADPAPVSLTADERVLFVPNLGAGASVAVRPAGAAFGRLTGVTAQNAGVRPTRFMAVYFGVGERAGTDAAAACADCGALAAVCSPAVAPGQTWRFPARPDGSAGDWDAGGRALLASAVVYSLNDRPARDYGPAWEGWLREHPRLGAGATLADIACDALAARPAASPATPAPLCDRFADFHTAYVLGTPSALWDGLPPAPLRGEPAAAVAAVTMPTVASGGGAAFERLSLDRYAAVPLAETGWSEPAAATGAYTSHLPGVYLRTPDGQNGMVFVQNAGTACAAVTIEGFRSTAGMLTRTATLHVPAGGWATFRPEDTWTDARGSVALRLTSDQPIAAAASNLGYLTGATHTARRARALPVAWAAPWVYQPPRPRPLARAAARADALLDAAGWETNVAVLNPATVRDLVRLETQSAGQPPRDASYPLEPLTQIVLQLGLGLGLTGGGPGWGRLSGTESPMAVALESIRVAGDAQAATEAWATAAWPYDPTGAAPRPRAFALPDLGGPAAGGVDAAEILTRTAALTDTLVGRIVVQNLYTGTARVAIDSYGAACGHAGSLTRTVDRLQAIAIPLADLPGTIWGADAAVVRVLEGEVAVMAEIARPERVGVDDAPPDATSAYLGLPLAEAPEPPDPAPARLDAVPRVIVIPDVPAGELPAAFRVADAAGTGRCLSFDAAADAGWVRVVTPLGPVPGTVRLALDTSALTPGVLHTAHVTVTAREPAVDASPQTVVVQVRRAGPPRVYFPSLSNGVPDEG